MKRHGDLFDKIVEMNNLETAFAKSAKGKHWQDTVKHIEDNLPEKLGEIREMLMDGSFKTSKYRIKRIYEPKERDIYILPFFPDRIIQHAIMNIVEPIWLPLFIKDSYACIKDRGQHAGSRRLMGMIRNKKYCLKCDVRKFYPSVNHEVLFEIIERKIKCKRTLSLFRDIIDSIPGESNIPIGNYTSQWMGNLYLNELDQMIKHKYKVKDYLRYCDDFILLNNDKSKLAELRDVVISFMSDRLKMTLGTAEIFPVSQGIDFLGYRHFPEGYVLLRKSTALRVKKRIKNMLAQYASGRIEAERVECSLASTQGWLRWANTHNLSLALEIDELVWRFRRERDTKVQ